MSEEVRLFSLVTVTRGKWPEQDLPVQPGDLSKFAPMGIGMGAPMVVRPWDSLEGAMEAQNFYGYQSRTGDPLRDAPLADDTGGVVYFNDRIERSDLNTLLTVMGVQSKASQYAIFVRDSTSEREEEEGNSPMTIGALVQARLILPSTLYSMFGAKPPGSGQDLVTQPFDIEEFVWRFLENERRRWKGMEISGCMGGDGDWAKERLAFGFMVENAYNGVYRVWSRAWLITK